MSVPTPTILPRHTTESKTQIAFLGTVSLVLLIASAQTFSDAILSLSLSLPAIAILSLEAIRFAREPRQIQKRYAELMQPRN